MGRPLAHVPDPAGDGHDSYARHFAGLFLDTFERLGVRPDRVYWMSEVYASGEMDRYIRVALDRAADRARHLPTSGQRPASRRVASAVGHLRELRPGGDHHRHRLGRGAGPLRVPSRPGGLGRGCGHAGDISPFGGRAKLPFNVDWAAKWSLFGVTIEPNGKDLGTKGGARDRSEAIAREVFEREPPLNVVYEFLNIGGRKMSTSKGRGAAAHQIAEVHAAGAAAPPLPAAALQPGHRLRSGRDRCHPARLRRVRPHRRRGGRARREGRAAGRRGSRCSPPPWSTREADVAAAAAAYRPPFAHLALLLQVPGVDPWPPSRSRRAHRSPSTSSACSRSASDAARAWLQNYAPDSARIEVQRGGAGWRRRPDRRSSARTFPPWPMRWAPPAGPATRCRPRSSASRRIATSRPARRSARSTSPSWASRAGRAPGRSWRPRIATSSSGGSGKRPRPIRSPHDLAAVDPRRRGGGQGGGRAQGRADRTRSTASWPPTRGGASWRRAPTSSARSATLATSSSARPCAAGGGAAADELKARMAELSAADRRQRGRAHRRAAGDRGGPAAGPESAGSIGP